MNKRELVREVGARLGDKKAAGDAVEAVLDIITTTVAAGDKVVLPGFGTFEPVDRPEREARNPSTGETIRVRATTVPKFKASNGFKERVANGRLPLAS